MCAAQFSRGIANNKARRAIGGLFVFPRRNLDSRLCYTYGRMEAFEHLVSEILWMEGYWVQTSVKINLTKLEKRSIGIPNCPRWEIDIVAYKGGENILYVVECKNFMKDGVRASAFDGSNNKHAVRFKLFNKPKLRQVVFKRLRKQLVASGLCRNAPNVQLALACSKIRNDKDRKAMQAIFEKKGWNLWDESWLRERLERMANLGYENQVSAVVAKLVHKGSIE
jgi:hypothetical protein